MLQIARGGYTKQEIIDALHAKYQPRNIRFKYNLLDVNDNKKGELSAVIGGEVSLSSFAQIKRTAIFDIKDDASIDWLSDRIQPIVELQIEGKKTNRKITWADISDTKWSDL